MVAHVLSLSAASHHSSFRRIHGIWTLLLISLFFSLSSCFVPGPHLPSMKLSKSSSSSSSLYSFWDLVGSTTSSNTNNGHRSNTKDSPQQLPFVIERVGARPFPPKDHVYREIADLCINVFFKEQLNAKPEDRVAPWKETQIAYLKALQTGDLRRRRERFSQCNEMFVAYHVVPATNNAQDMFRKPLILDFNQVYHANQLVSSSSSLSSSTSNNRQQQQQQQDYVRGDILGFCEITQRPYGLGSYSSGGGGSSRNNHDNGIRPVLTNLAVSQSARQSGIGSTLLDECERHTALAWKMNEIVLEVEDYNSVALDFYSKRGYQILFSDPASRRFDVGGLVLRKVRCTRQILRKSLVHQRARAASGQRSNNRNSNNAFDIFQRFRDTVTVF